MKYNLTILFSIALLFLGCNHSAGAPETRIEEAYVADSNSVGFDIEPAPGNSQSSAWNATYSARGKTSRFQFVLGPAKGVDTKGKNISLSFGNGELVAVPGSDSSELLIDLMKALEAKKLPTDVARVSRLPFQYAVLGEKMSQATRDGGFNVEPPGNWTAIKIFMGEGDKECEFFLNFNSVIKKGQFSIKDPDYGDEVLAQLAKVL